MQFELSEEGGAEDEGEGRVDQHHAPNPGLVTVHC
jgi:hypothetical protein